LVKTHFYSKQNYQNRPKGVFAKQLLRPKIPQQKKINQTKPKHLTQKIYQSG